MPHTYIALTGLTSHWNSPDNTLLLTDGCRIRGGEEPWRDFADPVDMIRFHGERKVVAAQTLCNNYALAYMPVLSDALEARLQLGYGQRFYQRIIAPWLVWFVQAAYDRYCSIRKAATLPCVCFITGTGEISPRSDALCHSVDIANDDVYNLLFYTDIIRALNLPEESRPIANVHYSNIYAFGDSSQRFIAKTVLRSALLVFENLFSSSTHLCYDIYGLSPLRDIWRYRRRLLPMSHKITLNLQLDVQFRATPLPYMFHDDFSILLSKLIPRYIPIGACEAVPYFVRWARQQNIPRRGVIATSVGIYSDPAIMVLAGLRQRPLAVIEHGGNGMLQSSDPHLFAQKIAADRYYSMGHDLYALPSPYLAARCSRRAIAPPLMVTNDGYRYLPRIMPTVCEGSMIPYHERRKSFLRFLAIELFPQLRLYYSEFGWGVRQDLLQFFPKIQFQDSLQIPMEQALADTCLLILDHYSTSFHRAMATNTPTIIFTPAGCFSAEAQEVIVQLRSVGIWHDTPENAASFYSSLVENNAGNWVKVEKDVKDWWLSQKVQSARSIFCEKFARTSPTWAGEWLCAFDTLAEEWTDMRN